MLISQGWFICFCEPQFAFIFTCYVKSVPPTRFWLEYEIIESIWNRGYCSCFGESEVLMFQ